jgi:hypothetical protein
MRTNNSGLTYAEWRNAALLGRATWPGEATLQREWRGDVDPVEIAALPDPGEEMSDGRWRVVSDPLVAAVVQARARTGNRNTREVANRLRLEASILRAGDLGWSAEWSRRRAEAVEAEAERALGEALADELTLQEVAESARPTRAELARALAAIETHERDRDPRASTPIEAEQRNLRAEVRELRAAREWAADETAALAWAEALLATDISDVVDLDPRHSELLQGRLDGLLRVDGLADAERRALMRASTFISDRLARDAQQTLGRLRSNKFVVDPERPRAAVHEPRGGHLYESVPSYVDRQLAAEPAGRRAARRLEIDLSAMLTGPTSGAKADRLARSAARVPGALAHSVGAAARRYLDQVGGLGETEAAQRLTSDVAQLLIGPTSGSEARRLAESLVADRAEEVAQALLAAAERYEVHQGLTVVDPESPRAAMAAAGWGEVGERAEPPRLREWVDLALRPNPLRKTGRAEAQRLRDASLALAASAASTCQVGQTPAAGRAERDKRQTAERNLKDHWKRALGAQHAGSALAELARARDAARAAHGSDEYERRATKMVEAGAMPVADAGAPVGVRGGLMSTGATPRRFDARAEIPFREWLEIAGVRQDDLVDRKGMSTALARRTDEAFEWHPSATGARSFAASLVTEADRARAPASEVTEDTDLVEDPRYREQHRFPKWNVQPTVVQEPRLFARVFPEMTKADHERRALAFAARARAMRDKWQRLVERAEREYGTRGTLIAGGFRDDWPDEVKEQIRPLAYGNSRLFDLANAHWTAAGKRSAPPWRGERA